MPGSMSDYPNLYGDLAANSGNNALSRDPEFTGDFLKRHQDKLIFGSDCACNDGKGGGISQGGNPGASRLAGKCVARETLTLLKTTVSPALFRKLTWENAHKTYRLKTEVPTPQSKKRRSRLAQLHAENRHDRMFPETNPAKVTSDNSDILVVSGGFPLAKKRRSLLVAPLIVLLCSMLGGLYGPSIAGASAASSEDDIKSSLKSFTKVLNLVEENFADKVTPGQGHL